MFLYKSELQAGVSIGKRMLLAQDAVGKTSGMVLGHRSITAGDRKVELRIIGFVLYVYLQKDNKVTVKKFLNSPLVLRSIIKFIYEKN